MQGTEMNLSEKRFKKVVNAITFSIPVYLVLCLIISLNLQGYYNIETCESYNELRSSLNSEQSELLESHQLNQLKDSLSPDKKYLLEKLRDEEKKAVNAVKLKTVGHILSYYLPILTIIYTFLTSKQAIMPFNYAPNGDNMARTRDYMTLVIFHGIYIFPLLLYITANSGKFSLDFDIETINNIIFSSQIPIQTFLAPGLKFYFGAENTKSS